MLKADFRLLQLAATAAGLHFDPTAKGRHGIMVVREGAKCQSDQVLWNPLTNDGDALRLAVKLRINVGWAVTAHGKPGQVYASPKRLGHCADIQIIEGDENAATRRAIVSAAAEIGKHHVSDTVVSNIRTAGKKAAKEVLFDIETTRFLTDVLTAAGLLYHGKTDKALAQRISDGQARLREKFHAF